MNAGPVITTHRLELVAATVEMARADIEGRGELGRLLRARVAEGWPAGAV